MRCSECDDPMLVFAVRPDLREHVPEATETAAICTSCLAFRPVENDREDPSDPDFSRISTAFPDRSGAAVPMALVVGLLPSLALYRSELEALTERVERAGVDPLLVLDRLAADPSLDPATDLERRRAQLVQLRS